MQSRLAQGGYGSEGGTDVWCALGTSRRIRVYGISIRMRALDLAASSRNRPASADLPHPVQVRDAYSELNWHMRRSCDRGSSPCSPPPTVPSRAPPRRPSLQRNRPILQQLGSGAEPGQDRRVRDSRVTPPPRRVRICNWACFEHRSFKPAPVYMLTVHTVNIAGIQHGSPGNIQARASNHPQQFSGAHKSIFLNEPILTATISG
jgi:hypothetical protein